MVAKSRHGQWGPRRSRLAGGTPFACLGGHACDDTLHIDIVIGLGEAQRAAVANNRGSVSRCWSRRSPPPTPASGRCSMPSWPSNCSPPPTWPAVRLADHAVLAKLGDPEVLGRVLALRFEATWAPATRRQRQVDSAELVGLTAASPDRRLRLSAARLRSLSCWENGRRRAHAVLGGRDEGGAGRGGPSDQERARDLLERADEVAARCADCLATGTPVARLVITRG